MFPGLNISKAHFCTEGFQKLRDFLTLETFNEFQDAKKLIFFGGIYEDLWQLNIMQYKNYHFNKDYEATLKDMEKISILFDDMVESLS